MATGGYRTRDRRFRLTAVGLPTPSTVVGAAIAYLIGVGIAALIPVLGGFAALPIWQLALRLIGVWVAAVVIDHLVQSLVGALVARSARNRERRKYTVVDALSGVVLLAVLTVGLSFVFDSSTAFIAAVIIAVLGGILAGVLDRTDKPAGTGDR